MDYSETVCRAKKFISENLSESLNAEMIATFSCYSTFHFCRIFKEYTGTSLMSYVREQRLMAADEEIREGNSAFEAAQKCGFETQSGFSRAYEKKFGFRPTKAKCAKNNSI